MKAVFDTKVESAYDDDTADRYHFPSRYLPIVSQTIDDWVIFRQPRASGGSLAYFATAKVRSVEPDPMVPGHYYAFLEGYIPFDQPTPWMTDGRYAEEAIRNIVNVPQIGLFLRGKSVRPLGLSDFLEIVERGFGRLWNELPGNELFGTGEVQAIIDRLPKEEGERERRIVQRLINAKVRDANFRRAVCAAYGHRCCVTGLELRDLSGNSEVQAAHIVPVAAGGADVIQNGLALSATMHWLFDRHLISISDDFRLLISDATRKSLAHVFAVQPSISLPENLAHRPSDRFICRHREIFFLKQNDESMRPAVSVAKTK